LEFRYWEACTILRRASSTDTIDPYYALPTRDIQPESGIFLPAVIFLPNFLSSQFSTNAAFGTGMILSSTSLGDIDGNGDLNLIVTGWDGGVPNAAPPSGPSGLVGSASGGSWLLRWNKVANDDHSTANLIRYQVAIATQLVGTAHGLQLKMKLNKLWDNLAISDFWSAFCGRTKQWRV